MIVQTSSMVSFVFCIKNIGMFPPQQLPDFINQLLILNSNVWDENRYWKITFSDPTLLKELLLNRLVPDDPSAEVKCYHLKNGSYYLVETERFSYRGDSLSITEKGIGIYSCLRNPDGINTNVIDFSNMIDTNYPIDYSKADLFPMYVEIVSNDSIAIYLVIFIPTKHMIL